MARLRRVLLLCWLVSWPLLGAHMAQAKGVAPVLVLQLRGVIDPVTARYVERGIHEAGVDGAPAVVILLDTPGGLDASMRRIVQAILASPVPVVTYVFPSGARAASAGVFVTAASHIAAMAPTTNLGAAHPVQIGAPSGEAAPAGATASISEQKAENDAAAYVRSIAQTRHRNADWLEAAVRKSVSASAEEARATGVVDLVAADLNDLLGQIQGRQVAVANGSVTLDVAGAPVRSVPMSPVDSLLHILVDPNIVLVLLQVGGLALLIELYHPGAIIPIITAAICFLLAFVGFEVLPMNWAGLALLALAFVLFIAELHTPGGGALGIGGVVSFVLGALLLFAPFGTVDPLAPEVRVSLWLIAGLAAVTVAFFAFVLSASLRVRRRPVMQGSLSSLVGREARVTSPLTPVGTVYVAGEPWSARLVDGGDVKVGDQVEVVWVEGLTLQVRCIQPQEVS